MNDILKHNLLHQYDQIELLIQDLDQAFLVHRHNPQKWSIQENLAHLGRYQEVFLDRLNEMLDQNLPVFDRYQAELDPGFQDWTARNVQEIVQASKAKRQEISQVVLELPEHQLVRQGIHPKLGSMNLVEWTVFFLLHESHHIYTVFWLFHQNRIKK